MQTSDADHRLAEITIVETDTAKHRAVGRMAAPSVVVRLCRGLADSDMGQSSGFSWNAANAAGEFGDCYRTYAVDLAGQVSNLPGASHASGKLAPRGKNQSQASGGRESPVSHFDSISARNSGLTPTARQNQASGEREWADWNSVLPGVFGKTCSSCFWTCPFFRKWGKFPTCRRKACDRGASFQLAVGKREDFSHKSKTLRLSPWGEADTSAKHSERVRGDFCFLSLILCTSRSDTLRSVISPPRVSPWATLFRRSATPKKRDISESRQGRRRIAQGETLGGYPRSHAPAWERLFLTLRVFLSEDRRAASEHSHAGAWEREVYERGRESVSHFDSISARNSGLTPTARQNSVRLTKKRTQDPLARLPSPGSSLYCIEFHLKDYREIVLHIHAR